MAAGTVPHRPLAAPLPGVDEAWARVTPQGLAARGFQFAARYYSYDRTGKNLTPPEAADIAAARLWIVTVWEFTPGAPLNGRAQGSIDALTAVRQAQACGQPAGSTIYYACDENFPRTDYPAIGLYFEGAASATFDAGYRVGAYAGYQLGRWLLDQGYIQDLWQTYAWSDGLWDPRAAIRQLHNGVNVGGADIDIDEADTLDYGQWQPHRLPTGQDGFIMDLSTSIPGTATPDHPANREWVDLLGDGAQLRNMLVIGDVKPPVGSPLAQLLAVPARVDAIASAVQSIAASLSNLSVAVGSMRESQLTDAPFQAIADALGRLADTHGAPLPGLAPVSMATDGAAAVVGP